MPTEPTLGWAEFLVTRTPVLAVWEVSPGKHLVPTASDALAKGGHIEGVTAFTPAVAVPASALDELREHAKGGATFSPINTFLAAVDRANGDAS